jgi:hypothetical protein
MVATGGGATAESLGEPPTTCAFTAVRSQKADRESLGKDGLAVEVLNEGDCQGTKVDVTIHLNPTMDEKGSPLRGEAASFNPWAWRAVKSKITGQDCCNIDMIWSWIRLYWWYDDYSVSDGSPTQGTGDNTNWGIGSGGNSWWWLQYTSPNRYQLDQWTDWHSCGFPTCLNVNVDAETQPTLRVYYNGTATCQYSHGYDGGAWAYPNLHWLDECWWDM